MADFNDSLGRISNETKALQNLHLAAKTRVREEAAKVEAVKADIAEATSNREVGSHTISCPSGTA